MSVFLFTLAQAKAGIYERVLECNYRLIWSHFSHYKQKLNVLYPIRIKNYVRFFCEKALLWSYGVKHE